MLKNIILTTVLVLFTSILGFSQVICFDILGKGSDGSIKCSGTICESDFFNRITVDINDLGQIEYTTSNKELLDDNTIKWDCTFISGQMLVKTLQITKQKCKHGTNVFFFSIPSKNGNISIYKTVKR